MPNVVDTNVFETSKFLNTTKCHRTALPVAGTTYLDRSIGRTVSFANSRSASNARSVIGMVRECPDFAFDEGM